MCTIKVRFTTEIKAKAEKVWDILADVEGWPKWQDARSVKLGTAGPLQEGSKFEAVLGGMRWSLVVTRAARPRSLAWAARRLGLEALHEWEFEEREATTVAITREAVWGWMAVPLYFLARRQVASTDWKWLQDLKARAESS